MGDNSIQHWLQVKRHVNKVAADICAWSLRQSASGVAPDVGFYGESFPPNTWRASMAGKPLALGCRCGVFTTQKKKHLVQALSNTISMNVSKTLTGLRIFVGKVTSKRGTKHTISKDGTCALSPFTWHFTCSIVFFLGGCFVIKETQNPRYKANPATKGAKYKGRK